MRIRILIQMQSQSFALSFTANDLQFGTANDVQSGVASENRTVGTNAREGFVWLIWVVGIGLKFRMFVSVVTLLLRLLVVLRNLHHHRHRLQVRRFLSLLVERINYLY